MTTSNLSFRDLEIPHFKNVLEIIDQVLTSFGISYYLIGVNAISLEFLEKGYKPPRATKDIDFAIMISSLSDFKQIVSELKKRGFNKVKAPWTLAHEKWNIVIDLLPFGEIEKHDKEGFNEIYTDLHVLGFKEVMEEASEITVENIEIRIPPLEGMVLLKLIAWSDRPEERDNDLNDILWVIERFNELEHENNMSQHWDLIPEPGNEEFDELIFSSRILGRRLRPYLEKSDKLYKRINELLNENTVDPSQSNIAKHWALKRDWSLEYGVKLLNSLKEGVMDKFE